MKLLLVLAMFYPLTWAKANKSFCSSKELQRKDCRLVAAPFNLRLLDSTVAHDNGTWRMVDPLPLHGEGVQWEKIRFEFLAQRPILQLWLWDAGEGAAAVQSLHWIVADFNDRKMTVLDRGVVRKRRVKKVPADEAEVKPLKQPYIYDAWETHELKVLKNGELEWTLGRDKKNLEKVKHGI